MKTSFIRDNHGTKVEVIIGLEKGNELECIKDVTSKGDIGMSGMTFDYRAFKKGNVYPVDHIYRWDFTNVAYVLDEDGCLHWATPDIFKLKTK